MIQSTVLWFECNKLSCLQPRTLPNLLLLVRWSQHCTSSWKFRQVRGSDRCFLLPPAMFPSPINRPVVRMSQWGGREQGEKKKQHKRTSGNRQITYFRHCRVIMDDETFHGSKDGVIMHQSNIRWFECVNVVRGDKVRRRSNKKGQVEADKLLTFVIVGCSRLCAFPNYEESTRQQKLASTLN